MANEIEDRFLVFAPPSVVNMTPEKIVQGYLVDSKDLKVRIHKGAIAVKGQGVEFKYPVPHKDLTGIRSAFQGDVRIRTVDDQRAFLTIKGKKVGNKAPEFEYSISIDDARKLHKFCGKMMITKDRYAMTAPDGHVWELDFFTGRHKGLTPIAEIELPDDQTSYVRQDWLGPEITVDKRFSNASMARHEAKDIMKWAREYLPKKQGPSRPAPSP